MLMPFLLFTMSSEERWVPPNFPLKTVTYSTITTFLLILGHLLL